MRNAKSTASMVGIAFALAGCSLVPTASPEILVDEGPSSAPSDDAGGPAKEPGSSDAGNHAQSDAGTVDEAAILATRGFRTSDWFVHATGAPYPSAAVVGSMVDEWVSSVAAADYEAVSADGGASIPALPVGSMIVREVMNDAGLVSEVTVLVKGPAG
jgi:hypothetical protein